MCGRFSLGLVYGFSTRFGVPEVPELRPRYNIAPFQQVPIIVGGEAKSVKMMRWGLVPHWAKGEEFGLKLINVRSESVMERPMFKPCSTARGAWSRPPVSMSGRGKDHGNAPIISG